MVDVPVVDRRTRARVGEHHIVSIAHLEPVWLKGRYRLAISFEGQHQEYAGCTGTQRELTRSLPHIWFRQQDIGSGWGAE